MPITTQEMQATLERAEASVSAGNGVGGTGFWRVVSSARKDPTLVERFGRRIAEIDTAAFERSVKMRVSLKAGAVLLGGATVLGIVATLPLGLSEPLRTLVFLVGVGILDVSTHSIAHVLVGRAFGIRFTHFFVGGPPPPRPGAKVDYESYLAASPRRRALMHASGALVTKAVPFAGATVASLRSMRPLVVWLLLGLGVVQIFTDILFSTKTSDWKKVKRELSAAKNVS